MYPIDEPLSPADIELLEQAGVTARLLRRFPVDGPFTLDEAKELTKYDVPALLAMLRSAPVDEPFAPEQVIEAARRGTYPEGAFNDDGPISAAEYIDRLR
ncbi:hypothetical protein [Devriesea agamarum]|uniref:hypothetical protein n=1 Tax=Devriesea agamarum TaxID=472569 RepID=UPI00071CD084|nr:hypothetical protein [Devriesea agamarum]